MQKNIVPQFTLRQQTRQSSPTYIKKYVFSLCPLEWHSISMPLLAGGHHLTFQNLWKSLLKNETVALYDTILAVLFGSRERS